VPRPTKGEIFGRARAYLDTDDLNFPNSLCDILLERIWFQAVTMEREWRFFQQAGTAQVAAGQWLVPLEFVVETRNVPATRLLMVTWNDVRLAWQEFVRSVDRVSGSGTPVAWCEMNDGVQRNIALRPVPPAEGVLGAVFYLQPTYPPGVTDTELTATFSDLPEEFDAALLEGLLAEMYMREEDFDLYDVHRQMFLEQMGAVRNRWRASIDVPLVVAGQARGPSESPSGFDDMGRFTQPVV
jgi:hypothetical protein